MRGGKARYSNRTEEVGDISRGLKQAAKRLFVPILAGAQLSRSVEQRQDKRPMLSDLRESGGIENDADVVSFLHQPSDNPNIYQVIVGKNRHGAVGDLDVFFHKATTRFHGVACARSPV
jgi:replicative DNA helicase